MATATATAAAQNLFPKGRLEVPGKVDAGSLIPALPFTTIATHGQCLSLIDFGGK